MTVGEGFSILGLLRSIRRDRPRVKILVKLVDHGEDDRSGPVIVISSVTGRVVHVEVHNTGFVPIRLSSIGFELSDGSFLAVDSGDPLDTITAPELRERHIDLDTLRQSILKRGTNVRLKGAVVHATPDRIFRGKLPKAWDKFPATDPPAQAGSPGGPFGGIARM